MDNISPLAKILAESNGIDWTQLQGTGAGGQIVEQDVINYLTRVMSGEAEPPPPRLTCRRPTGPATNCPQA
ncbi:E3 binding domain-containing protein [Deinococcus lacus]|uniref:E3 binding domain-containing protein n=1 Tax=Deinococcus lacus TaxID=392561 RepID=A0ABW1YCW4_9DEIO